MRQANAPKTEVVGIEADCLVVKVSAPPEGGRANRELVKFLKKHFKAKKVEIVKGEKSRVKIVKVIK